MEYPHYYHNIPKLNDGVSEVDLYVNETVPQNIVLRLAAREMWGGRRPGTEKYLERSIYQSVFPNFTIAHVEKPPCFLRKFTPDGKSFIAFSHDQTSVEVYTFQGPGAGQHLFKTGMEKADGRGPPTSWSDPMPGSSTSATSFSALVALTEPLSPPEMSVPENESENNSSTTIDFGSEDVMMNENEVPDSPGLEIQSQPSHKAEPSLSSIWHDQIASDDMRPPSQFVREKIFDAYFKLKVRIPVAPSGEQLNRECSLFTENSKYIVVGSAAFIQDEYMVPQYYELNRSNESVDPNPRYPLEDYTIHIVDIQHGCLCDSYSFKVDKIFLSHNQGIYLFNQTLAILSVQHQAIHLFHITEYGEFHLIRTIGRFCHEDDEFFISSILPNFPRIRPADEQNLGALKHRLLAKIYRRAVEINKQGDRSFITRFYQYYEMIKKLRIWKMQLLDEDHLLLKYSNEDVVTLRSSEPNAQHCLFAIYCISTTEVLEVYENTSDELVDLFENFSDNFRNNFMTPDARYSSSPANNFYAKQIQQRFRQTITSARFGGPVEATKRILAQLPISAQSFSASPYLDQALFSYDDHRVSMMERPKACGEIPIRFFGRDTGIYKFQLHAGILARGSSHSGRRLVAFTFHPSSPFAISVQRANAEYLVNFHVKLDPNDLLPL